MRRAITLSPLVVDYLCDRLGLELHTLLDVQQHGSTRDERRDILAAGARELANSGMLNGPEHDPELEDALHALARPAAAVGVASSSRSEDDFNAVCVRVGEGVVVASQHDSVDGAPGNIALRPVSSGELARTAVGLLPQVGAPRGASVSVPTEVMRRAKERVQHLSQIRTALTASGVKQVDAAQLSEVLSAQRLRVAQFTVRTFDRMRGMRLAPTYIQVFDTADGRYYTQSSTSRDGREWFVIAPTDSRRLVSRVEELLSTARHPSTR